MVTLKIVTLKMTLLTMTIVAFAGSVLAQASPVPQPDHKGNYFRNDAPILGTVPRILMPGGLWQVVSTGLNCRAQVGMDYPITRQFKRGELLQADVGRGGSDEVLFNAKDQTGNPWMRVRSASGIDYGCYVRANRRYIQPYRRR